MSTDSAKQIEQIAGDWLARRDSGVWAPADQSAFEAWQQESMLHRVAYLRLESAWEDALRLKALGAGIRSDRPPSPGQWNLSPFFVKPAESSSQKRRWVGTLVAGLAIALVAGALWDFQSGGRSYETAVGGMASVPMPDGSKITLNTNSEIKMALTDSERRVVLTHGEAFFEVAQDSGRPFVVDAGIKRVVALGTKFSVRRESNEVHVVVTEGRVRVGREILAAGAIARADRANVLVQHKELPEAEEQLSWRSGVLVFRNMTLTDAAAQFNRYNERKILIDDARIGALQIAGNFRTTNVDAFVRLLEQGYPVRTAIRENDIVLSGR
jgi:transmembrane sensor